MSRLNLENTVLDGRYEIASCLAQGSYAEIFTARDRQTAQTVIIKALNTHLQGTPDADLDRTLVENFENEARVLDRVRHPNIVRRLGHGTATDLDGETFHYLVLEYMAGGNLLDFCRRRGPLALTDAFHYFQQIVEALGHAHDERIVHRDIKPSNLLLSGDFRTIKITDFGIAKLDHREEDEITRVGTNVYAPPEHHPDFDPAISGSMRLTAAADVYSLAKTLYTVLGGQAPQAFGGRPITSLPPTLDHAPFSAELLRVLKKATAAEVSERYEDVESFWSDFTGLGTECDEETRVRTRPARSAPLAFPEAVPEARFAPSVSSPPAEVKASVAAARPGPARSGGAGGRIVISLEPSPPPVAEVAGTKPLGSLPATALPAPAAPVTMVPVSEPPAPPVQASPAQPAFDWRKFLESAGGHVLVTGLLLSTFAGLMAATYVAVRHGASKSGTLTVAPSPTLFSAVARTGTNVRSTPEIDDNIVGTIPDGAHVEVLEVQGKWYRIRTREWSDRKQPDIEEGWARAQLFEKQ